MGMSPSRMRQLSGLLVFSFQFIYLNLKWPNKHETLKHKGKNFSMKISNWFNVRKAMESLKLKNAECHDRIPLRLLYDDAEISNKPTIFLKSSEACAAL